MSSTYAGLKCNVRPERCRAHVIDEGKVHSKSTHVSLAALDQQSACWTTLVFSVDVEDPECLDKIVFGLQVAHVERSNHGLELCYHGVSGRKDLMLLRFEVDSCVGRQVPNAERLAVLVQ